MSGILHVQSTLLAASAAATVGAVLLALVPLAGAYCLLVRAGRRRRSPGAAAPPRWTAALSIELAHNYERLRHTGEAALLATDAWRRLRPRAADLPAVVRNQVVRTYHAIAVSNRLLAAAASYDHRGHLSLRQRRMQLWPTLEAAVRSALAALGAAPAPALRTSPRPAIGDIPQPAPASGRSAAGVRPAAADIPQLAPASGRSAARVRPAAADIPRPAPASGRSADDLRTFRLDDAPRLSLFHGAAEPATLCETAARRAAASRPRPNRRRAVARSPHRSEGQMPLWESVA